MKNLLLLFLSFISLIIQAQYQCPTWKWTLQLPGTPNSTAFPTTLTTDSSGNLYAGGHLQGTVTLGSSTFTNSSGGFVGKMDSTGSWLWAQKLDGIAVDFSALGPGNELILGGEFGDTAVLGTDTLIPELGKYNWAIALLDSNGNYQWAQALKGAYPLDISTDTAGNTIVAGDFNNAQIINFDTISLQRGSQLDGFVAKINHSGQWDWARLAGANTSVATTPSGESWVSGRFGDSATFGNIHINSPGSSVHIGFIDGAGQWQWVNAADSLRQVDLAYDNMGNCLVRNILNSSNKNYFGKIDSYGQWKWAVPVDDLNQWFLSKSDFIEADPKGGAYFVSHPISGGSSIFGTDTLTQGSVYLSKLSPSGQWEWAGAMISIAYTGSNSIAFYNKNNIFVSGSFSFKAFLGLDTLQITPIGGHFIAKFGHQQPLLLRPMQDSLIHCGDSVRLKTLSNSVAQLQYKWSPGSGMADSTLARPVVSPLDTITYTVQAWRDTCSASGQVTIDVDPKAGPANLQFQSSTGNFKFCDNGYTLSAPQGYLSYQWNTGDTGRSIAPAGPGVYSVVLTNTRGCIVEDSVEIEPLVQLSSPSNFQLCPNIPNDSVQLVATGPASSYLWSTGDTNAAIWVNSPGQYWLTASKGSCSYTDTLQVEILSDTANADFTYTLDSHYVHFAPVSKGVSEAHWTFGDGYSDVALNPTHRYQVMGQYTVCLATLDVCGYRDTVCKEVDLNSIGIKEHPKKESIEVYPNPASDILQVKYSDWVQGSQLVIIDLAGNIVSRQLIDESKTQVINVAKLPDGMYILKYRNHHQRFVKK